MRKSRFLISLIAATAIGLAGVGCESSDSGSIRDTTDISNPSGNTDPNERRNLREYLVVAQRGMAVPAGNFPEGYSGPDVSSIAPAGFGMTPHDNSGTAGGLLYELTGISNMPRPNLNFTSPGVPNNSDPADSSDVEDPQLAGFHQVYTSPTGRHVVALSRARTNKIVQDDDPRSGIQVFGIDTPSAETTYPPQPGFGVTPETVSIRYYPPGQGEFTSGAWSRDGHHFYVSINQEILRVPFTDSNGRLDFSVATSVELPAAAAAVGEGEDNVNNVVQMLASFDNRFIFALDNGNDSIVVYSRNPETGVLTESAVVATVGDPRGFAFDRSGKFIYVAGRESKQLVGYQVGEDGSLTAINLFGEGAGPATLPNELGDVATNPQRDELFLGAYSGVISGYLINPETGALTPNGQGFATPLGGHRNLANLEVEPTGAFVVAAYEHDYESRQGFQFANLDSDTNDRTGTPFSGVPMLDNDGRVGFIFPLSPERALKGSIQSFRIEDGAKLRVEQAVNAENPYGMAFFQLVIPAPVGPGPIVP